MPVARYDAIIPKVKFLEEEREEINPDPNNKDPFNPNPSSHSRKPVYVTGNR